MGDRTKLRKTRFGRSATERRFIIVFGLIVIMFSGASYLALAGLSSVHHMMHDAVDRSHQLALVNRIDAELERTFSGAARCEQADDVRCRMPPDELGMLFRTTIDALEGRQEKSQLEEVAEQYLRWRQIGDSRKASDELTALTNTMSSSLDALRTGIQRDVDQVGDHGSTVAHDDFQLSLIILIVAVLFTGAIGFYLARSVARPVAILTQSAQDIADGRLDTTVHIKSPSEFRTLAEQFNAMITATRTHEASIAQAERLAGLGRVAAGVAHEINNPLGVIRGYVQLLLRKADGELADDLQIIDEECVRCTEIVQGLLDLARPPVGELAEVQLRDLVADIVERLQQVEKHASVTVTIDGEATVWCDERSLRRVFVNLIENGCDAAAGGGGNVTVTLARAGDQVDACVEDDGAGLSNDAAKQIFEPFFTTKEHGTGLGLAVSRAIVDAHHGQMTAENRPEGGASFCVRLPYLTAAGAA